MEKLAITKHVRISPFKAREVARLIQGKGAVEAMNMVSLIPRKAARLIEKTLKSAVANAENDEKMGVDRSRLVVKEALIGEGATLKRGDLLGYVGVTGNAAADAPHLHFEILRLEADKKWWEGEAVNPYPFLNDAER